MKITFCQLTKWSQLCRSRRQQRQICYWQWSTFLAFDLSSNWSTNLFVKRENVFNKWHSVIATIIFVLSYQLFLELESLKSMLITEYFLIFNYKRFHFFLLDLQVSSLQIDWFWFRRKVIFLLIDEMMSRRKISADGIEY
jgi:hypothetical protein